MFGYRNGDHTSIRTNNFFVDDEWFFSRGKQHTILLGDCFVGHICFQKMKEGSGIRVTTKKIGRIELHY